MAILKTIRTIVTHPLNEGQKGAALARFLKWQLGSRIVPGEVVYNWINGSKFIVRQGETALSGNVYSGLFEFQEMGYLLHVLRPDDLFVDVGANVGSYSILAGAVVGASGICFEPIPATFTRLYANIRLNDLEERVQCVNNGLGSEAGDIVFTAGASDAINHVLATGEAAADVVTVPVSTLDSHLHGKSPNLLKVDVEGYETPVLKGGAETLENPSLHSVILELNDSGRRYGFDDSSIVAIMHEHGFQATSYDPFSRKLEDLPGKNAAAGNTIFVRDKQLVLERLRTAPEYEVLGHKL